MAGKRSKLEMTQMWADIVLDRWRARMADYNVGQTGDLLRSLQAQVQSDAQGDPYKITFLYLYYGRFTDMGVGRGVTLDMTPDPSGHRQVKPWYSQTYRREVMKLGIMMAAKYGIDAAEAISSFRGTTFEMRRNDAAWYDHL